jgi:hypothetical protein
MGNIEEKILAKGLSPPGPLLIVKKRMQEGIKTPHVRVIVSNPESVDELVAFFRGLGAETKTDKAGEDYHVIADLTSLREEI